MSIDLGRLRDAREFAGVNTAEREYLAKTADAVLTASVRWRCFVAEMNPAHPIPDASADGLPMSCHYAGGHSSRCGWVALVPIRQDET